MPFPFQQNINKDFNFIALPGEDLSDLAPQLQPGRATSDECDHKEVEQGEEHYGPEEHQYMTYWFCVECGEELEDEVV